MHAVDGLGGVHLKRWMLLGFGLALLVGLALLLATWGMNSGSTYGI